MERAFLGGFAMFEAFFFASPSIPLKLALAFCLPLFEVRLVSSIMEKSYPSLTLITGIRLIICFWHAECGPCTTVCAIYDQVIRFMQCFSSCEPDINNFFGTSRILLFLSCTALSVRGLPRCQWSFLCQFVCFPPCHMLQLRDQLNNVLLAEKSKE